MGMWHWSAEMYRLHLILCAEIKTKLAIMLRYQTEVFAMPLLAPAEI